jgi:hypothetical protein
MIARSPMTRPLPPSDVTNRFEHTGDQVNTSNVVPYGAALATLGRAGAASVSTPPANRRMGRFGDSQLNLRDVWRYSGPLVTWANSE